MARPRGYHAHESHPPLKNPPKQKSTAAMPNKIAEFRQAKDMTQEELAVALGVSRITISSWENGWKSPRDDMKRQLCRVFHCSVTDLFSWEV